MLVHSGERPFSCEVCGQTFTTNGNMHRHHRTHNVRDSCESDGSNGPKAAKRARKRKSSTVNISAEHQHSKISMNPSVEESSKYSGLKCPICPERFYSELSLEVHVINYHPGREIRCEDCGHPCPTYNYFKLHRNMFHFKGSSSANILSSLPPTLPPPPPTSTFNTVPYTANLHLLMSSSLGLKQQQLHQPPQLPQLLVPAVSAPFSPVKREDDLSMDNMNTSFSSETLQDDDPVLKEMKLKGEFPCRLCPAVFPNLRALKGHNKEHMIDPPFVCNVSTCLYSTTDKSNLIQHMRGHTGQKPFECKICNFGFTTKANCERHVKNKHNKNHKDDFREHIIIHDASALDDEGSENGGRLGHSFDADVIFPPTPPRSSTFIPYRPFEVDRDIVDSDEHENEDDTPLDLSKATNNNVTKSQKFDLTIIDDAKDINMKSFPFNNSTNFQEKLESQLAAASMAAGGGLPLAAAPPTLPFGLPFLGAAGSQVPHSLAAWPAAAHFGMAPGFPFGAMQLAAIIAAKNEELKKQQQLAAASNDSSNFLKDSASAALQQLSSQVRDQQLLLSQISPSSSSLSTSSPKSSPCKPVSLSSSVPSAVTAANLNGSDAADHYKMVIKNGVLMRKQKQRRYRTERPYGCEECKARFTLRSNMDRHMKQQHPEVYYQKPRPGPGRKPLNQTSNGQEEASMLRKCDEKGNSFESEIDEDGFEEEEMDEQNLIIDDDNIKNTHIHINDDEENLDIEGVDDYEPELDIEGDDSKKLSAYSAAPQRLSCPYCARKFPWASSLERHILTHTGQKPYKCTECPLWFTTKSNCDRHIVRKHGNNKDDEASYSGAEDEEQGFHMPLNYANTDSIDIEDGSNTQIQHKTARRDSTGSESPYKCHICDEGFGERQLAISHIQLAHQDEFLALQAKGAFDEDNSCSQLTESAGEEQLYDQLRGKFPDYSNRKIICLFCSRKFWSAEDLRRHVRTHSGERPYSCDICNRKFTLKHSMLRHKKKHDSGLSSNGEEGSDDDIILTGSSSDRSTPDTHTSPADPTACQQPADEQAYDKKRANLMEKISRLNHNSESSC